MRRDRNTAFWLMTPLLTGILIFFLIPLGVLLWQSMTFGVGGAAFVGLSNYVTVMKSVVFQLALKNTLLFIFLGVLISVVVSFLVALMLRRRFLGSGLLRSVILFPMFLPVSAVVILVMLFFSETGAFNVILEAMGVPLVDWMNSEYAFALVLGLYIMKSFGFNVILFLASLTMIPKELYEAADMEGAGPVHKVFHITIPMISPTLFFVIILSISNCTKSFREIFILGGEHPHKSVYMLSHFIHNNMQNLSYQRLSVATVLVVLFVAALAGVLYYGELKMEERLR